MSSGRATGAAQRVTMAAAPPGGAATNFFGLPSYTGTAAFSADALAENLGLNKLATSWATGLGAKQVRRGAIFARLCAAAAFAV